MTKITFYRSCIILIILMNIINYFFLVVSYTGTYLKEGITFFERTFFLLGNIEPRFGMPLLFGKDTLFFYIIFIIIDLILIIIMYKSHDEERNGINGPFNAIYTFSMIGILLHIANLNVVANQTESFAQVMFDGMFGNEIWIISYIIIMILTKKYAKTYNEKNIFQINLINTVCLFIAIELIIAFFYFSIVNNIQYLAYNPYTNEEFLVRLYRYFYSPFEMTFTQINYFSVDGVIESYPYMWITLIFYFILIALLFLQNKISILIRIILSFLCIVVMFIGAFDILDSIVVKYITLETPSFFNVIGYSFYVIVSLLIIYFILQIKNFCDLITNKNS